MSLEEIKARALAAAAEKQQQQEREQIATKEAAVETEVQTHQDKRAELYGRYQERLSQIDQKKEQLAGHQANREKELNQIEQIRESLGLKDSELSAIPQTVEELKQSGLSEEELDPYLQEIQAEQQRLETERQQLQGQMEQLQDQVNETDRETTDLGKEEEEAKLSSDLAAEQSEPLSPDAMAKIQEQALAENERMDKEKREKAQAEFMEKFGAELRSDVVSVVAHLEQAAEDAGTPRDKAFVRGENNKWDLDMPTGEVYVNDEKLDAGYVEELQRAVAEEMKTRFSDEYVKRFGKPDESGEYSGEAYDKLAKYKQKLSSSRDKIRQITVATTKGRRKVWG